MFNFEVADMTCGHCERAITEAVKGVDSGADVQIDRATHRVSVRSATAGAKVLAAAIREAGYSAVLLNDAAPVRGTGQVTARSGCCCR